MVNKDWRPFAYGGLASIAAEFGNILLKLFSYISIESSDFVFVLADLMCYFFPIQYSC